MRLEDTNYTSQGERMRDAIKGLIWGMAVMAVLYILHYMVAYDPMWGFELRLGMFTILVVLIIATTTDDGTSKQARVLKAESLRNFRHWNSIAADDDKSESLLLDSTDVDRYFCDGWLAGYQAGQESRYWEIAAAVLLSSFIVAIVGGVIIVVLSWLFG